MSRRSWIALSAAVALGTAAYMAAPADTTSPAGRDPAIRLTADISERKLVIEDEGGVVRQYDIAVGQAGYPTPRGDFLVRRIVWNPSWRRRPVRNGPGTRRPRSPATPTTP